MNHIIAGLDRTKPSTYAGFGCGVQKEKLLLYLASYQTDMRRFRKESLDKIRDAATRQAKSLNLSDSDLEELPADIFNLTSLEDLNLSRNRLVSLPPEIGNLRSLRTLNLSRNKLATLPREIAQVSLLDDLNLHGNELAELPAEIGSLKKLKFLVISDNKLRNLPREIGALKRLLRLDLRNNDLESLPPEVGGMINLNFLYLDNNRLATLPTEIRGLRGLHYLEVNHNMVDELPPEIAHLTELSSLGVAGNPLRSTPPEIVSQGTKAVMAYLNERLLAGTPQWTSKLLVVGEGGVGKTCLLRTLRGEEFEIDQSTTHGIEIRSLEVDHPHRRAVKMQLKTWDFGGQEIYHATHQFFLTNRSLFILVWNSRHGFEQGKLYYWLDTIKARAPESPVIVVATHSDERAADIPISDLRGKYRQIVGHFELSNKTGAGIAELLREIANQAASLPLMGESWPSRWLDAANEIRSVPEDYIRPVRLNLIMEKHGVKEEKAGVLSRWLHELGDILYFREDPELNDTVILNPQWVTRTISRVLESESVIENFGLFNRDHMDALWADVEAPMRDHLLRLMEKFDLSYRTLENRDISLVVERLNYDPPNYEQAWNEIKDSPGCKEISLKVLLNTTMPAGVPTWFIARTHRFTTRTHWRYGALFADSPERKHLGLVQAYPHERFLKLTVRGPLPYNFFTLLHDGLELTLDRFPGLEIDRKVPCPGHDESPCTHEFDLSHLEKRIERDPPKLQIKCPITLEEVSVPRLIFGLTFGLTSEVIAAQNKQILEELRSLTDGVQELSELSQREFLKDFHREQEKIESYCPNVFVLRPHKATNWLADVLTQSMELQLFCQAPGEWHPSESGGNYLIENQREWVKGIMPYVRRMFGALKFTAPLLGPWVSVASAAYEERFKADLKLMEELVKKLPDVNDAEGLGSRELSSSARSTEIDRLDGAELRSLRALLKQKDPHEQWGGLKLILTPEGHYLWLCRHHAREYLP